MKENFLDEAFLIQSRDNSYLAEVIENRLNSGASAIQDASQRVMISSGSAATSMVLDELASSTGTDSWAAIVNSDLLILESSDTQQDTILSRSALQESEIMQSHEKDGMTVSTGYIDDQHFVFMAHPLPAPTDHFVMLAVPTSQLVAGLESEQYQVYLSDNGLSEIYSFNDASQSPDVLDGEESAEPIMAALVSAREAFEQGSQEAIISADEGGESIVTTIPIAVGDETFWLFASSPVSSYLSGVSEILFAQRIQTFSLLAGTSLITIILALFLSKNLRLDREVKSRTSELEQSNLVVTQQKKELERANVQLKQLDVLKDQFISIASHELKNPIQPIIMYADLAKRGNVSMEKALDGISVEARRLKKLADDILDVSRIESGSLRYKIEKIKLKPLIDEVISGAKISVSNEVSIEVLMQNSRVEIDADADRIAQVLQNVISNSLKFTTRGQITITVDTDDREGTLVIAISDTGDGIPEDIVTTVFEKFVTKSVGDKNSHGTGLGLYISRAIVTAHGGRITAENRPEGGAVFTIILPLNSQPSKNLAPNQLTSES